MQKLLLFCLCITPVIVTAAANNNADNNLKAGQFYLFHGRKALQQGNLVRAKQMFEKSAALGYPGAAELLATLPQVAVEQNQLQGPRGMTVERNKQ